MVVGRAARPKLDVVVGMDPQTRIAVLVAQQEDQTVHVLVLPPGLALAQVVSKHVATLDVSGCAAKT